jgi:transposase
MRGQDAQQDQMFSYVSLEDRIPSDHPLRAIRTMADKALRAMSPLFDRLYAPTGRESIPPERLLRALLLQALYSVRSERQLMEQMQYNLLYRWFVGLNMDDPVWDVTVFTKNRDRLLEGEVAHAFFEQVLAQAKAAKLLSAEHFTVDGTLIEAWASHKSFKRKDSGAAQEPPEDPGNPTVDFHGEKRSNQTHQSTTDPDARLFKKTKGAPAQLCYLGHVLMENRHGLVVGARLTQATGTAEREACLDMIGEVPTRRRITLGADKNYDVHGFVNTLRALKVTAHVAQNDTNRKSAIDRRTTRHPGYAVSMRKRKRVEEIFGWLKTVGLMRKTRHRGTQRVDWMFTFAAAAYNLTRMRHLVPAR